MPMPKASWLRSGVPALLLCLACGAAAAHEGHHDDDAAPATAAQPAPATVLDTPQLEVVARREGSDLVFYVDDYAGNAPLDDLQLSLRSGTSTLQAAGGDGVYRVAADLIDAAKGQPLELAVHGAGIDVRLPLALPPEPAPAPVAPPSPTPAAAWVAAAAASLLVVACGCLLQRRRAGRVLRGAGAA